MHKLLIAITGIAAIILVWYVWPGDDVVVAPTVGPSVSATPLADDLLVLEVPLPGATITSPLTVRGSARGTWFFEADFPVFLTDWDGRIIATGIATAQDDWMTEEFVPFEATLTFETPSGPGEARNRGTLILQKDNPSGLPEHDDAREITVFFE